MRQRLTPWVTLAVALAVLAVHAWTYMPFVADDAMISLRYAQRFLEGKGLTWNDGERVEGYSNLLWTLSCAGLGALGVDLIVAARVLGLAGMAATIAAVVYAYRPGRAGSVGATAGSDAALRPQSVLPSLAAAMGLALAAPVAVWAIGGLEQPMLIALLSWALVLLYPAMDGRPVSWRGMLAPGALLALVVLTRPEGPMFTTVICLCLVAVRRPRRQALLLAAVLAVLPIVAYLGQLAFRLAYYGEWVPNTAHAKVGFSPKRIHEGLLYIAGAAKAVSPLLVVAALALVAAWRQRAIRGRVAVLLAIATAWIAYIVLMGGDIFHGWRQFLPVLALAALLAAQALSWLVAWLHRRRVWVWAGVGVLWAALLGLQAIDPENRKAKEYLWPWDGEVIGQMLARAFGDRRPLMAVDPAGCLPYFSRLPSLDMLGLNDKHIARHRPPGFTEGEGWLFHDLGDGQYVLGRRPDLVIFSTPRGHLPSLRSGKEMLRDPRFLQWYQPVRFEATQPREVDSIIWVKREGGPIAIQREERRVAVPAYFACPRRTLHTQALVGDPNFAPFLVSVGLARLDEQGRAGTRVKRDDVSMLPGIWLPPGVWRLRAEPSVPQLRLAGRLRGVTAPFQAEDSQCTVEVPDAHGGLVDIAIGLVDLPEVHLRTLLFERLE